MSSNQCKLLLTLFKKNHYLISYDFLKKMRGSMNVLINHGILRILPYRKISISFGLKTLPFAKIKIQFRPFWKFFTAILKTNMASGGAAESRGGTAVNFLHVISNPVQKNHSVTPETNLEILIIRFSKFWNWYTPVLPMILDTLPCHELITTNNSVNVKYAVWPD